MKGLLLNVYTGLPGSLKEYSRKDGEGKVHIRSKRPILPRPLTVYTASQLGVFLFPLDGMMQACPS